MKNKIKKSIMLSLLPLLISSALAIVGHAHENDVSKQTLAEKDINCFCYNVNPNYGVHVIKQSYQSLSVYCSSYCCNTRPTSTHYQFMGYNNICS
ncbi:MAG: hypothetical protein HQK50_17665 [Oligoflexia bacterium]|nr:hypothetical protein [Oligoflexia bacterium]